MRKRSLIGVTGPATGHGPSWFFIWLALKRSGADMVRLRPQLPHIGLDIDGLIVSGGSDIDPLRYGKERKPHYSYDQAREELERGWIAAAQERKIPVMGICRGAQLLNVVRGGSLYMDIRLVCETAKYPGNFISKIFYRKPVIVKEGSWLEGIFGERRAQVNSLHRQSLDQIGEGLTVTAWEENTIVQAVEGPPDGSFMIGVQWHPEFMPFSRHQLNIFKAFVARSNWQGT